MAHKILVVDDEKVSLALVKYGLADTDYRIITAHDGEEALVKLKEEKPALIILDIEMPNMNGFEFLGELKMLDKYSATPVIVLTGKEKLEGMFDVKDVAAFFVKPVEIPVLVDKIEECLKDS